MNYFFYPIRFILFYLKHTHSRII
jgi:C2H2-type zinc finger/Zinc finger, C2H2 type